MSINKQIELSQTRLGRITLHALKPIHNLKGLVRSLDGIKRELIQTVVA